MENQFDYQKQPGKSRTRFYAPDPKDALVSVITPFYNAGKYFEQTFNSVMNQTFPWFEWIIVNDGSTREEDVALLNRLAAMDRRITVITQENGGLSCARNTGIAHTHTDLVVPLDADDVLAPTYLDCLYWGLYYNQDAAWCYTSSYGFHDQEYIWKYPFNSEKLKTYNFLNYTAMIRKKDILDIGGYKVEKWSYYEDWRFWLEMLAQNKKPVHVNSCLFWYRRLDSGMLSSINKDPERVRFCKEIIEKAAGNVHGEVKALEFPISRTQHSFYSPKKRTWDRPSFAAHDHKRVLWLVPWLQMGGADKFNLDAIAGLKEQGMESFILTTKPSENVWQQKFEDYTDEIFCLPDFLDPAHYLEFVSYFIQSREIDAIMLTNSYDGYYMMPWIRQHFPDVVIVDYVHMEEWYWLAGGYARTSGALSGVVEKTYVCNSRTRRVMTEKFGRREDSVQCLYIGVDHHYFSKELEEAGYLHRLLKLPPERKIVLFPCRIHAQKRPFLMLEIADELRKKMPDAAVVVAGDGNQLAELQEKIRQRKLENTVFCIGGTDRMRACYRDSDLTLICSLNEGLALTAYESLSMGVPVVSSDVGGQRDLVGPDVGALIPMEPGEEDPENRNYSRAEIDKYVSDITAILQDEALRSRLSQNGRKKIEEGFSIDCMVSTLVHELEYLCTDPAKAEQRREISRALNLMSSLGTDYYSTYMQWQDAREECEEVWRSRCWFESQWKKANGELDAEQNQRILVLLRRLLSKVKRKLLRLVGRA